MALDHIFARGELWAPDSGQQLASLEKILSLGGIFRPLEQEVFSVLDAFNRTDLTLFVHLSKPLSYLVLSGNAGLPRSTGVMQARGRSAEHSIDVFRMLKQDPQAECRSLYLLGRAEKFIHRLLHLRGQF